MDENSSLDESMPCPVCREIIKRGAVKCRFCNTNLAALAAEQEAGIEKILFSGHPSVIYDVWQWIPICVTLGLAYFYYWVRSLSIRYLISTQRIKVEYGLLSKTLESVELFTIEHFDVIKPLGMRLVGHCRIVLHSSDVRSQNVGIYGIPNLEALADQLRECSLRERTRRRITSIIQP